MGGNEQVEDQALDRLRALAEGTVEQALRVRREANQAAAARAHTDHARKLLRRALEEQRDQER